MSLRWDQAVNTLRRLSEVGCCRLCRCFELVGESDLLLIVVGLGVG